MSARAAVGDQRPPSSAPLAGAPLRLTRRLVILFYAAAAVVLLPWSGLLAAWLPQRQLAAHWDIAWTGFDIALAATLLAVAVSAWRRSIWLEGSATAAAALLLSDAWFDLLTAASRQQLLIAALEAALVELPLAGLCVWLARRAKAHWLSLLAADGQPAAASPAVLGLQQGRPR